ncbi:MAG: YciI family protein [Nitrospiraceae bacterium]
MRFMTMVKSLENLGPPPKALMDAIAKLSDEGIKEGTLIETGGLFPSSVGARVRLAGGKFTVTDGPFIETSEVIGGYAVVEVESRKEAIEQTMRFMELHKEHWPGWEGETEIRQIFEKPDFGPRKK